MSTTVTVFDNGNCLLQYRDGRSLVLMMNDTVRETAKDMTFDPADPMAFRTSGPLSDDVRFTLFTPGYGTIHYDGEIWDLSVQESKKLSNWMGIGGDPKDMLQFLRNPVVPYTEEEKQQVRDCDVCHELIHFGSFTNCENTLDIAPEKRGWIKDVCQECAKSEAGKAHIVEHELFPRTWQLDPDPGTSDETEESDSAEESEAETEEGYDSGVEMIIDSIIEQYSDTRDAIRAAMVIGATILEIPEDVKAEVRSAFTGVEEARAGTEVEYDEETEDMDS